MESSVVSRLAVDDSAHISCRNNPVDVDLFSLESTKERGLYAMGPLVADNFVRFAQGGALAITNNLLHTKLSRNHPKSSQKSIQQQQQQQQHTSTSISSSIRFLFEWAELKKKFLSYGDQRPSGRSKYISLYRFLGILCDSFFLFLLRILFFFQRIFGIPSEILCDYCNIFETVIL